ncbi:hypothetical protein MHY_14270 [Megamonas hypermegale ART12/1]|nr:hypothetical protein MHY_14270 [Megamonas hypermegale ART12/1]
MKYAISTGKKVLPRIPVIPKFNDSLEDAKRFCEVLHDVGSNQCQLLPFHQFGENKYHLLNKNTLMKINLHFIVKTYKIICKYF